MSRTGRHPKKEIAEALGECRAAGLMVEEIHRSHRWGRVVCPACGEDWPVASTPRSPSAAAKRIGQFRKSHQHPEGEGE